MRLLHLSLSIFFLVFGVLFYLLFRTESGVIFLTWPLFSELRFFSLASTDFPSWIHSLPTFLHVLSFSFLTASFYTLKSRNLWLIPLVWFLVNGLFEILQAQTLFSSFTGLYGTFDQSDLLSGALAAVLAYIMLSTLPKYSRFNVKKSCSGLLKVGLLIFGVLTITATSDYNERYYSTCERPIFKAWKDIEKGEVIMGPIEMKKSGKIYVKDQFLFISEPGKGIHIVDNTDPSEPKPIKFISILGNQDMAVKEHVLYADSYLDLLLFDLSKLPNVTFIKRMKKFYPYRMLEDGEHPRWPSSQPQVHEKYGVVVGCLE